MVFLFPRRSWSRFAHDILFSTCLAEALRALSFLKSSHSQRTLQGLSCGPEALWVPVDPRNSHPVSGSEWPDGVGQASNEPLAPNPSLPHFPHCRVSKRGRGGDTPPLTPTLQSEQSFRKRGPNRNEQGKFPHIWCVRSVLECFALSQSVSRVDVSSTSMVNPPTPLLILSVLFSCQAGAEFINILLYRSEKTSKIF